eukprot:161212_1
MSGITAKFEEYKAQHGHNPNASQLARFAGVRYSVASTFLRNGTINNNTSTHIKTRSQTVTSSTFSPVTKTRTSSFSKEIYSPPKQTSSTGIDYSGSTTGANNPWKQFQKSKSTYSTGFSQSYSTIKPKEKPKPKSKPKPQVTSYTSYTSSPQSPRQSITSTVITATNTASAITVNTPTKYNFSSKKTVPKTNYNNISNGNINELRNQLNDLNNKYER